MTEETKISTPETEVSRELIELRSAVAEFCYDIGNANGSIMIYSSMVLNHLGKDKPTSIDILRALAHISRIKTSSMNIKGLTKDLLEFATGKTDLNKEICDLEDLEEQLDNLLGFTAELPIEYVFPDEVVHVELDVRKILRVVVNLVKNAFDKLSDHEDALVEIHISVHQENLKIQVLDNGDPISEEMLPKLFQSFQTQVKEKRTGLGPAISKKIVEAHNGRIRAENLADGKGVLFEIILPRCVVVNTSKQ